jgi:hypothetical protein
VRGIAAAALAAALGSASAVQAAAHPGWLADLPDSIVDAVGRAGNDPADAQAILDRVLAAGETFTFPGPGLRVVTDRRWFAIASVEGPGAPALELRRFPGDTTVSFYRLPGEGDADSPRMPGLTVRSRGRAIGSWTRHVGTLLARGGARDVVWLTTTAPEGTWGALGIAGDGGLGSIALADMKDAILAVVRHVTIVGEASVSAVPLVPPDVSGPLALADETKLGWQVFQGPGFTLGLPPGLRAVRLDLGAVPARPMPFASVWIRGRFVDRDGATVAVGDGRRAGYVSLQDDPDEVWRAGVAPPRGAPGAEKIDEAPLDELVLATVGAAHATVGHWKEPGFAGDWLVFRLLEHGRGVEIALPVLSSWRSLALFWIPATWRREGEPPAPPPIDPARSLGVRFDRLAGADRTRTPLLEGTLYVADLRFDVPRGWWPVANLASRDGLPVSLVDAAGRRVGRIALVNLDSGSAAPSEEAGWSLESRPSTARARSVWTRPDGSAVLVSKDGHAFLFAPDGLSGGKLQSWTRMRESASFTKAARR